MKGTLSDLARLREALPPGEAPRPAPPPGAPASPKAPSRAVLRLQRKGRGGKEVTTVEKLDLPPDELARWSRELKGALGCGGAVEGEVLVFQGDHRARLAELLVARGVRRVG